MGSIEFELNLVKLKTSHLPKYRAKALANEKLIEMEYFMAKNSNSSSKGGNGSSGGKGGVGSNVGSYPTSQYGGNMGIGCTYPNYPTK